MINIEPEKVEIGQICETCAENFPEDWGSHEFTDNRVGHVNRIKLQELLLE